MLNRLLPEEVTLNDIRGRMVEAGVDFEASQVRNADGSEKGATAYMDVLNKAVAEIGEWEEVIQNKTEQIPSGRGKATHPKPDDPYYRLHQKAIGFIIDLRNRRDEMEGSVEATSKLNLLVRASNTRIGQCLGIPLDGLRTHARLARPRCLSRATRQASSQAWSSLRTAAWRRFEVPANAEPVGLRFTAKRSRLPCSINRE
jgi:hypothetical protein